jgi:hypothetical protein
MKRPHFFSSPCASEISEPGLTAPAPKQRPEAMFHSSSSSASDCSNLSMHHAANLSALPTDPAEIPRSSFFHDNGGLLAVTNVAASAPPPYYIHRTTLSHLLPLHLQLPDPVTSNAILLVSFNMSIASSSCSFLPFLVLR